jgi:hypothetical protein
MAFLKVYFHLNRGYYERPFRQRKEKKTAPSSLKVKVNVAETPSPPRFSLNVLFEIYYFQKVVQNKTCRGKCIRSESPHSVLRQNAGIIFSMSFLRCLLHTEAYMFVQLHGYI